MVSATITSNGAPKKQTNRTLSGSPGLGLISVPGIGGGGANLKGLVEQAERMFNLPVRLASPRGLEGMPEELSQPEYATVVGLLLYGARARRQAAQRPTNFVAKIKSMFAAG